MCGEKGFIGLEVGLYPGSPPRMRGKAIFSSGSSGLVGITPACAGKSTALQPPSHWFRDHPRACGEKTFGFAAVTFFAGSPPRMRGKVIHPVVPVQNVGITPACAGKRASAAPAPSEIRDHPCVCGEKTYFCAVSSSGSGSPPRMRGKDLGCNVSLFHGRITPACAGKSRFHSSKAPSRRDHPRVCGEKTFAVWENVPGAGSPPRMRGKVPSSI